MRDTPRRTLTPDGQQILDEIDASARATLDATHRLRDHLAGSPAEGRVIKVGSGSNLQAAIDEAVTDPGTTEIRLEPRAVFDRIILRPRPGATGYVIIRPDFADSNLPPDGHRMTPAAAADLPRIRTATTSTPAVRTEPGAGFYSFLGVAFDPLPTSSYTVVELGSDQDTTPEQQVRSFVFDRVFATGDLARGQHRFIAANCGEFELRNSHCAQFFEPGRDAQVYACWNAIGGHILENNYLEASGENTIVGGAGSKGPALAPANIRIVGNHVTKDWGWQALPINVSVKNGIEFKHARDVYIAFNVIEHVWTDSQTGYVFMLTPSSQYVGETWLGITNLIIEYNVIRHAGALINMNNGQGADATTGTKGVVFRHNVVHDLNAGNFRGEGRLFKIGNRALEAPANQGPFGMAFDHNTIVRAALVDSVSFYGTPGLMGGMRIRDNIYPEGNYGIKCSQFIPGEPTLIGYAPDAEMFGNAIERHPSRTYKYRMGNTVFPTGAIEAQLGPDFRPLPGSALAAVVTTDGTPVGANLDVPTLVRQATTGMP